MCILSSFHILRKTQGRVRCDPCSQKIWYVWDFVCRPGNLYIYSDPGGSHSHWPQQVVWASWVEMEIVVGMENTMGLGLTQ